MADFVTRTWVDNEDWNAAGVNAMEARIAAAVTSKLDASARGAANGVAPLVSNKVPAANLPSLVITDTFVVASQAAMLALSTAEQGDVAIRTDLPRTFILKGTDPAVLGNWAALETPTSPVQSVAGRTGVITLVPADVQGTAVITTDSRLSDTRTPTDGTVTAAKVAAALKPSGGAAAGTEALRALGTTSSTAAAGDDSRLTNARTPTAHKSTHATGGSDALVASDIGAAAVDGTGRLSPAQTPLTLVNAQTAAYTLVLTDHGKAVEVTSASAVAVTIPTNVSVAFPVGTTLEILQGGAGQITLTPASGVTLREREGKMKTAGLYATVGLRKRNTDEWVVTGDVVA